MALYLIIAICVCIYHINSHDMPVIGSIVSGLIWPVTFIMYLFTIVTGRPTRNPITGITAWPGGRSRNQRSGKSKGGRRKGSRQR
ncbi:hypothetical protein [Maridesulfovibrio sp.]|uniref:hypothetical protein n=1 Tax=Maridesulfovibrio sp. TaxID=2795000 RepID=UPI0029F5232A|nr:hypothetical protein [Maridesulfovibrio sp.]